MSSDSKMFEIASHSSNVYLSFNNYRTYVFLGTASYNQYNNLYVLYCQNESNVHGVTSRLHKKGKMSVPDFPVKILCFNKYLSIRSLYIFCI